MEYALYIFLAVLAIAIWIAYRLWRYFLKKTLFLAYTVVGFILLLMIVSAYFYFKLSS
jgi:hypothetical protein